MARFLGRTIQKISSFYRSFSTAPSAQAEAGISGGKQSKPSRPNRQRRSVPLATGKRICGTSIGCRASAADKSSLTSIYLPSMPACAAARINGGSAPLAMIGSPNLSKAWSP